MNREVPHYILINFFSSAHSLLRQAIKDVESNVHSDITCNAQEMIATKSYKTSQPQSIAKNIKVLQ